MEFNLIKTYEILSRTPSVLELLLKDLSQEWLHATEGENTWSAHIVIGHLVFAEEDNWMPRLRKILSRTDITFKPFDRFAQLSRYQADSTNELLQRFSTARRQSLSELNHLNLTTDQLKMKGIHPDLGEVTLSQLLSAWTVHDLDHINQISRVLAKQYSQAVGPWIKSLGVLKRPI
jgi:uncharacterized damage-inducible protein DinB